MCLHYIPYMCVHSCGYAFGLENTIYHICVCTIFYYELRLKNTNCFISFKLTIYICRYNTVTSLHPIRRSQLPTAIALYYCFMYIASVGLLSDQQADFMFKSKIHSCARCKQILAKRKDIEHLSSKLLHKRFHCDYRYQ